MTTTSIEAAKLLLLENVNDSAVELLESSGFSAIDRQPTALEGEALRSALKGVSLLGIRSRTSLTSEVFAAADQLIAVGCFSVGTNQVDLDAARKRGIPVFNATHEASPNW
jgi:D-3-phosphoglycerate dehydrogenase